MEPALKKIKGGFCGLHNIATAEILISGLNGLGVEVAKNVIIEGVKSVVLHDECLCTLSDLSSQFHLNKNVIGVNRAKASLMELSLLNKCVKVSTYTGELTEDYLKLFDVIILTDSTLTEQFRIGAVAHTHNIGFIVADTKGLFGQLFCDFGKHIYDVREEPLSAMLSSITKDKESVVVCLDETKHGFEDGDYVTFSEVVGMTELNGCEPRKIKVLGPYTFSIGDTSGLSDYIHGGIITEVKMPKRIDFKSFSESIVSPKFIVPDVTKSDRIPQLHLAFQALHYFKYKNGRLPQPWNKSDAEMLLSIVKWRNERLPSHLKIDDNFIRQVSYISNGDLCPMQSVMGGITAQEVLKYCSGKFHPIFQWLYFDSLECVPKDQILDEEITKSNGCRYDQQIAVFGNEIQKKLENLKYFIAGAGAVGCEYLKNFSMMGVGTGEKGRIFISDSKKWTNRDQKILFKMDLGTNKAESAAENALKINPDVKITYFKEQVGYKTEVLFDDNFFQQLNGVLNTINTAENYMILKSMYYHFPLVETKIKNSQGHSKLYLPNMTEISSSSSLDKEDLLSTVNNYPYRPIHVMQWTKEQFYSLFEKDSVVAHNFLNGNMSMSSIRSLDPAVREDILFSLKRILVDELVTSFRDCVLWAREKWEYLFKIKIDTLLDNFPPGLTLQNIPFWKYPKKLPHNLTFSVDNILHLNFIMASANIKAKMHNIAETLMRSEVEEILKNTNKIEENKVSVYEYDDGKELYKTIAEHIGNLTERTVNPIVYDQDDQTNFNEEFIIAASSLRAENYEIPLANSYQYRNMLGTPEVCTTATVISGLVCLELYKLVQNIEETECYREYSINCNSSYLTMSSPVPAKHFYIKQQKFNSWSYLDIPHGITLEELLHFFFQQFDLKVILILHRCKTIYGFFIDKEIIQERLRKQMHHIVEIENDKKFLMFNVICQDLNENNVNVPTVRYPVEEIKDTFNH